MTFSLAVLVVVVFGAFLELLEMPGRAREVADRARESLRVLRDPELEDRMKERALRRQALQLFRLLGILAGGSLLALAVPLSCVWLLERAGAASLDEVLAMLEHPAFLSGATLIGLVAYLVLWRSPDGE